MTEQTRGRAYRLAACGVMTALLCVLAPFAIPIGPVPVTLATLLVYLSVELLGWKLGAAAVTAYLLIGLAGAPVFSGYQGGPGPLFGPTGGYLAGYVPLALIAGWVAEAARPLESRGETAPAFALRYGGMALGTAALYALGTAWYCVLSGNPLPVALGFCVTPFLPFDLVKMALAIAVAAPVRRRLQQARILP